jgi:endoglucanase
MDYAFQMNVRASQTKSGGVFHVEVDGVDVSGPLKVPNTGSFDTFRNVTKTVWLPSTAHIIRFAFDRNANGSDSVGGFDSVTFTPVSAAQGVTITNAAYVRSGASAGKNFGAETELQVKRGGGTDYNRETLLKLDLSSIPSISTARLRLDGVLSGDADAGVQVAAFASTNTGWDEKSVTWNTRPSTTGAALATTTILRGTDVRSYEWNLTNFLQAQKAAGKKTVTIVLRGVANTDSYVKFLSDDQSSGGPILLYTK